MPVTRVTDNALWCPADWATELTNQRKLVRKRNGDLACCYLKVSPDGWEDVYCATSTDGGVTWTEERVPTGNAQDLCVGLPFPAMAVDSKDNLHIIFSLRPPALARAIYYTVKEDGAWSTPVQVNDPVSPGNSQLQHVAIAVDSLDNVHCVWSGEGYGLNPDDPNLQYKQRTAAGIWQPQEAITDLPNYNRIGSIAIDAADNVHVAWEREAPGVSDTIHYKQRLAGVWQPEEDVAPEPPVVDDQECPCIALDSSGEPHVVWHGKGWGAFPTVTSILHRHRAAGGWQPTEVVMNHQFGGIDKDRQFPTICIDAADDIWVAAYGDGDNAMDYDNIYYDKRPWSAGKGTLVYDAEPRQRMPIMIWAFHPIVEGIHSNIPLSGFELIWTINKLAEPPPFPTPAVLFFEAPALTWPGPRPYSECAELCDGYMEGVWFPWADGHDAPSCLDPDCAIQGAEEHLVIAATYTPGFSPEEHYYICRAWLYFDTSDIPPDAIITRAILALFPEHVVEDTPGYATLHVVEGVQATPLQPDDWGNHLDKIISGGSIAFADWVWGVYNVIELNATGIGWISKGGATKFCLRLAADINDTPPPGPGSNQNAVVIYSAEKGELYCPLLKVNYTLPKPPPGVPEPEEHYSILNPPLRLLLEEELA